MQPQNQPHRPENNANSISEITPDPSIYNIQHDLAQTHLINPPLDCNQRGGRDILKGQGKKIAAKWKGKGKPRDIEHVDGESYLLELPSDVLHLLLSHLPPRTLLVLSTTCRALHDTLKEDSIWRESYVNRFVGEAAVGAGKTKSDVKTLVQGVLGVGRRGWKKEALGREAMLDRWTVSRAAMVLHQPPVGILHSLSLSYPHFLPPKPVSKPLVVGRSLSSPTNGASETPPQAAGDQAPTPPKMSHRAKYEALLAATTRPPPFILSAGLETGGLVKSDPFTGKVSKGFWGPGRDGEILDIWMLETEPTRWVTGGADGRVKVWQLDPGENLPMSAKKTPTRQETPGTISCLFTSDVVQTLLPRSEEVRRRQVGKPDGIVLARCDVAQGVACGVTRDGDLRIWFGIGSDVQEVRIDAGSEAEMGGVERLEMKVRSNTAEILIHHKGNSTFTRYNVLPDTTSSKLFITPTGSSLTKLSAHLDPAAPLSLPAGLTSLSARIISSPTTPDAQSPIGSPGPELPAREGEEFGKFVVGGDEEGKVWIWPWEGSEDVNGPIRGWSTGMGKVGKVTAIDVACGLVAIGSYDGEIHIYDPLPATPVLLRSFNPTRLSLVDLLVAASDDARAKQYSVNQIILDNDLVVASIGRRVLAWRAGISKGRQGGKDGTKGKSGKGESRSNTHMKALHQHAVDSHNEIQEYNNATKTPSKAERQHRQAMEDLGFEDGDDALQYALMISQQEQEDAGKHAGHDRERAEEMDAVRAVERAQQQEAEEIREMLEMIRMAEQREGRA
ncbi:hypothetical protein P7C73_g477, partial [Tremellales sp. Uapishka_1]